MAHLSQPARESELREYLLADAKEFRQRMTETLLDHSAESAEYAWTETSKRVDQLAAGKACRIHRFELPFGHVMRDIGGMSDDLLLDQNDVLRPA